MNLAAAPPQPLVPGPPISAPSVSRIDAGEVPPPPGQMPEEEGPLRSIVDRAPRWLPRPLEDAFFAATRRVNDALWPATTQPGAAQPRRAGTWTFGAIGDYGSGRPPMQDVVNNIVERGTDLVVTLGDNVYYTGSEEEYGRKWDPDEMFGALRRTIPVRPALGNHDTEVSTDPYFRRFPELDGARYYSFDKGDVHFAALNSTESLAPGSPQYEWLNRDLGSSDARFKVLYLHHPMFPGYPTRSPLQGYLAPLVARHGVELVLSGHEHNYARSQPFTPDGAVEVIAGGGGHALHPFAGRQRSSTAWRDVSFGHVEVEVRDTELVGRYVERGGEVRDTWTVPDIVPKVAVAEATATHVGS